MRGDGPRDIVSGAAIVDRQRPLPRLYARRTGDEAWSIGILNSATEGLKEHDKRVREVLVFDLLPRPGGLQDVVLIERHLRDVRGRLVRVAMPDITDRIDTEPWRWSMRRFH